MSQLAVSLPSFPPLITVIDPRNGQTLYSVEEPSEADVHAMYARAQAAFERLRGMSVRQRLDELDKLKQYILKNREHIARRIVEETGKCITDAMIMEIFPALDQIAYYQKNAEKILADRRVKMRLPPSFDNHRGNLRWCYPAGSHPPTPHISTLSSGNCKKQQEVSCGNTHKLFCGSG